MTLWLYHLRNPTLLDKSRVRGDEQGFPELASKLCGVGCGVWGLECGIGGVWWRRWGWWWVADLMVGVCNVWQCLMAVSGGVWVCDGVWSVVLLYDAGGDGDGGGLCCWWCVACVWGCELYCVKDRGEKSVEKGALRIETGAPATPCKARTVGGLFDVLQGVVSTFGPRPPPPPPQKIGANLISEIFFEAS